MKEKEQDVYKKFQETKKKLIQEKKSINSEIKNFKKVIKLESEKENQLQLLDQQQKMSARLEDIERLLLNHEMEALQLKYKIK